MRSLREVVASLRCDNVLECFFGLNELDVSIYRLLLGRWLRSQEVARLVGKGENAVYKSLQKLIMCGLVIRERRCVDGGGYCYVYSSVNPEVVAAKMIEDVEELKKKLLKAVEEFKSQYQTL